MRHVNTSSVRAFMYAVGALMVGCTAHQRPSQIETRLANAAKDLVIPLEAEKLKNPLPVSDQVIQQGEEIYMEDCGICHASDGHSRTNLGRNMYPPAMDLTSPHVQHWSDAELFWIVQNGVRLTGMPSWKSTISETDTWKLVRFVKAIPGRDAARRTQATSSPPAPKSEAELIVYGRTLYRQEGCFTCHQLNGEGAKFGPDLTVEGTRGRQREWLLGHFKNPQAYTPGSMMPAFTNLTDEQLEALATFLEHQTGEKH